MLALPEMLLDAAEKAGIETPEDPRNYEPNKFLHFHVFCNAQLGQSVRPGEHYENAKVIAAIPVQRIKDITYSELFALGFN